MLLDEGAGGADRPSVVLQSDQDMAAWAADEALRGDLGEADPHGVLARRARDLDVRVQELSGE
jgi:hypothetical protein